ncbi:DUF3617 family protein [Asticcacaulis sp. YBE204]|uniref:DUF3617 domain-containing protein n=1 Tax=Asticcacaulis sp. YBE204 TaxID=1282363 RepID=UPI0003C40BF1|nr:DUF3617 family protein [Asticcacaulis sp. YBE204]ESQ79700.1 hypothetical protein AEYBE204_07605 [Asticcacaulis sp. YBE204]
MPRNPLNHRWFLYAAPVVAGLSLLTACGKKEKAPEPEATPAAAVVEAPPKPMDVLPLRKPGLWDMTMSEEGSESQAQTMQICIDAATEKQLGITGTDLNGDRCQKNTVSHLEDGSWGILAECNMGTGGMMEISGKIVGDYTSNYTMTLRSQTTGAAVPHMNRVVNMTILSKRLGACKAEQKPGDVILPGDVTFNLFDMAGKEPGQ